MIGQGAVSVRPPHDSLKLLLTGLAIVGTVLLLSWFSVAYNVDLGKYFSSQDAMSFAFWAAVASVVIAYILARLVFGKEKMNDLFTKSTDKFFRSSGKDK